MGLIFRVIHKFHEFFGKKIWLDLKIDPFVFCFHLQSALCRIAGRAKCKANHQFLVKLQPKSNIIEENQGVVMSINP